MLVIGIQLDKLYESKTQRGKKEKKVIHSSFTTTKFQLCFYMHYKIQPF